MANLCSNCKNFEKCIGEKTINYLADCLDNDYIGYLPKNITCDKCFYEDWPKLSVLSPCWNCIRQPVGDRVDNYISKDDERNKYDE